jgi:hypothetical protein
MKQCISLKWKQFQNVVMKKSKVDRELEWNNCMRSQLANASTNITAQQKMRKTYIDEISESFQPLKDLLNAQVDGKSLIHDIRRIIPPSTRLIFIPSSSFPPFVGVFSEDKTFIKVVRNLKYFKAKKFTVEKMQLLANHIWNKREANKVKEDKNTKAIESATSSKSGKKRNNNKKGKIAVSYSYCMVINCIIF